MKNFSIKKIRSKPKREPISEQTKQNLKTGLVIVFIFFAVYFGGGKLLDILGANRLFGLVTGVFGKELAVDERGHTNFLLMGVGGEGHEGKDLTDTIIIASIDQKNHSAGVFGIPRDLYIESSLGGSRVNRLYEKGKLKWGSRESLDFVRETFEGIFKIPIHYTIKVDFEAFEKIIDELGGIDVFVEQEINDPQYPKGETYEFETFLLPQGMQHLDGETALKYVRSRKTTSDFDRSKRQQQVMIAMKEKAADENLWARKRLLRELYYSLSDHMETNLDMREMLTIAEFAASWDSKNLAMATLNDEPIFRGGFLYTPFRELYGGAYVLLPAGENFNSVNLFAEFILYGPPNSQETEIAILNGTKTPGLAAKAREILNRFGLRIVTLGNASNQILETTRWHVTSPETEPVAGFFQKIFPGEIKTAIPAEYQTDPKLSRAKIILELGKDSEKMLEKWDIFKNIVSLVPSMESNPKSETNLN